MKRIKVGNAFEASAVVMGCMRIDGATETPDKIINTALELGIDYFDHADIYGGGRCEEIFGSFLEANKSLRDKISFSQNALSETAFLIIQRSI